MEDAAGINAAEWSASAVPGSEIIYRTSSLINQLNPAKKASASRSSHATWVIASRELAHASRDPVPELPRELWIVTHADLRRTTRVRTIFDVAGEGLTANPDLFEGRAASQPP